MMRFSPIFEVLIGSFQKNEPIIYLRLEPIAVALPEVVFSARMRILCRS